MGLAKLSGRKKRKKPVSIEPTPRHRREKHRRFVLILYEHGKGMGGITQSHGAAYATTPPRSFFARTGSTTPTTFSNNSGTFLTLQLPPSSKQWTWFFLSGAV